MQPLPSRPLARASDSVVALAACLVGLLASAYGWKLAFLAGGHCHTPVARKVGTTPLVCNQRDADWVRTAWA